MSWNEGVTDLKDLVGERNLDAVDFFDEQVKGWLGNFENCQVVRFRLDGVAYTAMEDPDDGYRSRMSGLAVSSGEMKNVFHPVRVIARHRTKGSFGYLDDVLELVDAKTGGVVLEVGTVSTDGYYPCFVASFHPEEMATNR